MTGYQKLKLKYEALYQAIGEIDNDLRNLQIDPKEYLCQDIQDNRIAEMAAKDIANTLKLVTEQAFRNLREIAKIK